MNVLPPLRLVRASVFAAVCVVLASAGHTTASGRPLGPGAVLAGFAGALVVAIILAERERSLAVITGGLLGGQFMLHSLFTAAADHHENLAQLDPAVNGAEMTAAHLLAALGSGWWLRRGERRVWRLARQAAKALIRPLLPIISVLAEPVRHVAAPSDVPPPRAISELRHVLVLRGPPRGFPALSTV
ncbi:MFS transporter [Actinocorallia sp. B10E7]|uniref:MFS transporter n=1 Tax=Actinocorallia sp. B10E7 TaxID=3153558 RepID=UPI00325CEA10